MAVTSRSAGTHLRGARLGSKAAVAQAMEELLPDNDPGLYWGGLHIPTEDGPRHFCVMGATGSGKTVLLRLLMQSVLPRIGSTATFDRTAQTVTAQSAANAGTAPSLKARHPVLVAAGVAGGAFLLSLVLLLLLPYGVSWLPFGLSLCYLFWTAVKAGADNIRQASGGPQSEISPPASDTLTGSVRFVLTGIVLFGLLIACTTPRTPDGIGGFFGAFFSTIAIFVSAAKRPAAYGGSARVAAGVFVVFGVLSVFALPFGFVGVLPGVFGAGYLIRAAVKGTKERRAQGKSRQTPPEPSGPLPVNQSGAKVRRAVVYDAKQDSVSLLRAIHPHCPLVILNPFDTRCAAWDMAKDITRPSTADQVATILIPENKASSQPFFTNAARQLLAGVFKALMDLKPGDWTFRDVILATKSRQQLTVLLERTPYTKDLVGQYFANEMTAGSILSELATRMGPYEHIAAAWSNATKKVSLSHWAESEYILILGNDEAHRAALDAVNRLIFQRLTELILARPETSNDQTWIFLDEVREAGELEGLSRLLNKGRSKGACVVLGFQDIEGMRSVYGNEIANEIIGQCNHMALLRLNSPETSKWASERIGECETIDEDESFQEGTSTSESDSTSTSNTREPGWFLAKALSNQTGESRTTGSSTSSSKTRSQKKVIKAAVLASEFLSLPLTNRTNGLTGFFIVPQVRGGAYRGEIPGDELFPRDRDKAVLVEPDGRFPNFVERPASDERLTPWTPTELARLGFPAASTPPHPTAPPSPAPPPVPSAAAPRPAPAAPSTVTPPRASSVATPPPAPSAPAKSAPAATPAASPKKEAPRPAAEQKRPPVPPVAPEPAATAAPKRAPRNIREDEAPRREGQVPRASEEEIARLNAFLNRGR